ncbi:cytochrome b [Prolixibacteraceae bacterium JC049]|nr:cytochrome b [Prolixibacteraceae bacterium JC049]
MYSALLHSHSGLRYLVLIGVLMAIFTSIKKKPESFNGKNVWALIGMALMHLQFLVGFVLYFSTPKVMFSSVMFESSLMRFFTLEHPVMMLLSLALITVGYSRAKKRTGNASRKQVLYFYLVGLLIMLAAIPWPFSRVPGAWM